MAKITGNHPALIQALKNAGVDTDNATRVVIDVQVGELVKVYVQHLGDDRLPGALPAMLAEAEIIQNEKEG
jgi:hypothetical protein